MARTTLIAAAATALLVLASAAPTPAANVVFDCTLKGKSETFGGQKFKFTGAGTMTIDDVAGTLTYSFALSNGLTFSGQGTAAITEKGRVFGSVDTSSPGIDGVAVVEGAASKDRRKFTVKIAAAIPNRLGAPPQGFVLSKMTAKGTRQAP